MHILTALPPELKPQAARLYWEAFGGKLGRVLGPTDRALRFLDRIIRCDHALVAVEDGRLLGLVGFKTPGAAFADGRFADLWAVYGMGALWRVAALRMLSRDIDNERFLLDGLCVAAEARGMGIGTALLAALGEDGRRRGYRALRLDVVDTNPRARALYERLGFRAIRTTHLGPLRLIFGFRTATTMVRDL
jgi:ribosomal protein S18 acetylase RimI-like enzyme